jgi:hypothetical protein
MSAGRCPVEGLRGVTAENRSLPRPKPLTHVRGSNRLGEAFPEGCRVPLDPQAPEPRLDVDSDVLRNDSRRRDLGSLVLLIAREFVGQHPPGDLSELGGSVARSLARILGRPLLRDALLSCSFLASRGFSRFCSHRDFRTAVLYSEHVRSALALLPPTPARTHVGAVGP